jgi:hypothetical protein
MGTGTAVPPAGMTAMDTASAFMTLEDITGAGGTMTITGMVETGTVEIGARAAGFAEVP